MAKTNKSKKCKNKQQIQKAIRTTSFKIYKRNNKNKQKTKNKKNII